MPRRRPRRPRPVVRACAVVGAGALLAGCGGDPRGFADADVRFATDVTVHHAQTLQVLDLSLGRESLDPALGDYADATRQALFDEVDVTQSLLRSWDQPVPETALQHDHGAAHDVDTSIPGVLSPGELRALETAGERRFQAASLAHLVELEEGAVELARAAVEDAESTVVLDAAERDLAAHQQRLAALRRHAAG